MKIAVIGTGYVGLVTAVVLADRGHDVITVDNNPEKLAKLRAGISPIYEPGVEDMLASTLATGRLTISDSVAEATQMSEIIFIAVGTPSWEDGSVDMAYVYQVAKEIGSQIKSYKIVVNKSTVPIGTGREVARILQEAGADAKNFDVISNPEFLREGSALKDTLEPDRIIIGSMVPDAADRLSEVYKSFDCPILKTTLESAELIKYASNCFLAVKISYINAFSRIAEICGADVADVAAGMGFDDRIGKKFLQAGLGWGGSCLPKDTLGLLATSREMGYDFGLLEAAVTVNNDQIDHFIDRIRTKLGGFNGKTVGLLGLAFKPNTDDIRYAKSLDIIQAVTAEGGKIRCHDPVAMDNVRSEIGVNDVVVFCNSGEEVAHDCDVLVLVTEWAIFKSMDYAQIANSMNEKILFDGRRALSPAEMESAGFEYFTVGSLHG